MYTALYENTRLPIHTIKETEFFDTGDSTAFRTVYAHRFVVGSDCMRIFDPVNIKERLSGTDTCREYIVEVTGTGFFNLHHRTVIGIGQFIQSDDPERLFAISNGWRLADALLPAGMAPYTWPINYSICWIGSEGYWSENVICQFNDLYDYAMVTHNGAFGDAIIINELSLQNFLVELQNIVQAKDPQYGTAEMVNKMTTDAYVHKFYGLGTSLAVSACEDENVVVTIRILRRQLTTAAKQMVWDPQ